MKLHKDLREFIALLNSHKVDYLIVGGHAVAFHGYPRFTGDTDFLVRPTAENAQHLIRALDAFGFGGIGLDASTFTQPDKVVQLGRPPNRIDLLTSISGVDFKKAWEGRVDAELDGLPVCFLGRAALLQNKRATGRTKDLDDVEKLTLAKK